jgi:AbrB family looped-hinge helix DNA binding protein
MRKKKQCCKTGLKTVVDFRVEALVSVDARGQMVLPKDLREKAGIRAGDKLALVSWLKDGRVCCLGIVKLEELTDILKERLGPILKEIMQEE